MFSRSSISVLYLSRSLAIFLLSASHGKGAVAMRHAGDKKKMQNSFIPFAIRIFEILCEKQANAVSSVGKQNE
jgi:hypothetical protein